MTTAFHTRCIRTLLFVHMLSVTCTMAITVPFAGIAAPVDRNGALPIEVNAAAMNYDRENGRIAAEGNVVIVSGADLLRADRVLVNVNTGDVLAIGNVELEREGEIIRATQLRYNTNTRISSLDTPRMKSDPYHVVAERISQIDANTYRLQRAKITTCILDHDHAHYHIRARNVVIIPGDQLRTTHAVWYFGRVPVFYVPHWRRRLHDEYGWNLYPGYRSRWGGYFLTSYFHRINSNLRLEHHVDLYSERGVGLGETVDWRSERGRGRLALYSIHDRKPLGDTPPLAPPDVDEHRYRIFMRHDQSFDDYTRLLIRNEYVSDSNVRRDFFDRDYRRLRQPENYATLSHQREQYTITALANYRLNDFYRNVNRIPEISLDWYRMQVGDSSFYYESESAAAYLQREYASGSTRTDHATLRIDTQQSVYQPRRLAGWLHVVPRAGYRATYYSNSRNTETLEIVSAQTVTNALTDVEEDVSQTNRVTRITDGSMKFRQVFEVGSEISFKAFKRLADSPSGQPWRHVVEPYANYTFRLKPTVLPADLYRYDAVDQIDKRHDARIGVRNLLQTKRGGQSVEAVEMDLYTTANFDATKDQNTFSTITMQSRFRPSQWMKIDTDGIYSLDNSTIDTLNTRLTMNADDSWSVGFEHRFRNESSNIVMFDSTFAPHREWKFNVYTRYDFEMSRLEEQGGFIQRRWDCMVIRIGGSMQPSFTREDGTPEDADYRVSLEFWLTAFPQMSADGPN